MQVYFPIEFHIIDREVPRWSQRWIWLQLLSMLCLIISVASGIGSVAAALLGLGIMLITNVVSWKECLSNNAAWDTLTWFAALIGMASYLNKYGFIKWFSDQVSSCRLSARTTKRFNYRYLQLFGLFVRNHTPTLDAIRCLHIRESL